MTTMAQQWALRHGVAYLGMPALWEAHGRSAGPRRNQRLINLFTAMPALRRTVLAFPYAESPGTRGPIVVECDR